MSNLHLKITRLWSDHCTTINGRQEEKQQWRNVDANFGAISIKADLEVHNIVVGSVGVVEVLVQSEWALDRDGIGRSFKSFVGVKPGDNALPYIILTTEMLDLLVLLF